MIFLFKKFSSWFHSHFKIIIDMIKHAKHSNYPYTEMFGNLDFLRFMFYFTLLFQIQALITVFAIFYFEYHVYELVYYKTFGTALIFWGLWIQLPYILDNPILRKYMAKFQDSIGGSDK